MSATSRQTARVDPTIAGSTPRDPDDLPLQADVASQEPGPDHPERVRLIEFLWQVGAAVQPVLYVERTYLH